jgi:hypothetical protein
LAVGPLLRAWRSIDALARRQNNGPELLESIAA